MKSASGALVLALAALQLGLCYAIHFGLDQTLSTSGVGNAAATFLLRRPSRVLNIRAGSMGERNLWPCVVDTQLYYYYLTMPSSFAKL